MNKRIGRIGIQSYFAVLLCLLNMDGMHLNLKGAIENNTLLPVCLQA